MPKSKKFLAIITFLGFLIIVYFMFMRKLGFNFLKF